MPICHHIPCWLIYFTLFKAISYNTTLSLSTLPKLRCLKDYNKLWRKANLIKANLYAFASLNVTRSLNDTKVIVIWDLWRSGSQTQRSGIWGRADVSVTTVASLQNVLHENENYCAYKVRIHVVVYSIHHSTLLRLS